MISGILEWRNERTLSDYPLSSILSSTNSKLKQLFVDANFTQFDEFIPKLTRVAVEPVSGPSFRFSATVLFSEGEVTATLSKSDYLLGARALLFSIQGKFLGTISLGENVFSSAFELFPNASFDALTVSSVLSSSGIFTVDGNTTASFSPLAGDNTVFFNLCDSSDELTACTDIPTENALVFNGVTNHVITEEELAENDALKKINLVGPTDNNLVIAGNEVVRVTAELDRLIFELVGFQNATKQIPVFSTVST